MEDSILNTIKSLLGINEDINAFDGELIVHINSVLSILRQLGIGPPDGFAISGESDSWDEFIGDNPIRLNAVKTYVYMRVKLLFDPPSSSSAEKAFDETIKEFEWRLNAEGEGLSDGLL